MAKHWSENDFLMALYGVGPEDGHLETCTVCREQWQIMQAARKDVLRQPDVPPEYLVRQRHELERRLDRRRFWLVRWSPAMGAVAMMAAVLIWHGSTVRQPVSPGPEVAQTSPARSDAQWMTEIYQTAYELEPAAVSPVRALFEANQ